MFLQIENLSFRYAAFRALRHIFLEAGAGDMLAVVGRNGSGKSTLLKCLCRVLRATGGTVRLDGVPIDSLPADRLARLVAYIPQSETAVGDVTVFDAVLLGRKPYIRARPAPDDLRAVAALLARLELEAVAMRPLRTLSGGQQQRVFIARALAQEPALLLLDEPIANLDLNHQVKVMKLLRRLADGGMTVVLTIHDINLAARFCNRTLMLREGEVFAAGGEQVYTPENIRRLYDMEVDVLRHKDLLYVIPQ